MWNSTDTPSRTITHSRVKMWYLTKLCRQKVSAIYYSPTLSFVGIMFYSRTWVLIGG